MTAPRGTRHDVPAARKPVFLPPRYREPLSSRRVAALDPERPALRLLTISLLAVLFSLLAWGVVFALLV